MKRVIVLHVLSLLMLQLVAQTKTVNIHGVVKDTTVKSIEISHVIDDKLSKWENTKLNVENGAFNTAIQIPFPVEINISYGNKVYGKNYIYSDAEILIPSEGKPHVTKSPIQDEYENEFLPFFQSNDQAYDSLRSFYGRNYGQFNPFTKEILQSKSLLIKRICKTTSQFLRCFMGYLFFYFVTPHTSIF
jgi:hypothetical protein